MSELFLSTLSSGIKAATSFFSGGGDGGGQCEDSAWLFSTEGHSRPTRPLRTAAGLWSGTELYLALHKTLPIQGLQMLMCDFRAFSQSDRSRSPCTKPPDSSALRSLPHSSTVLHSDSALPVFSATSGFWALTEQCHQLLGYCLPLISVHFQVGGTELSVTCQCSDFWIVFVS